MANPNDIVSNSEQISLNRDPQLSRDLVAQLDYVDSEQDAIRRTMRQRVRWGRQGILPEQLLAQFKEFIDASSGEFEGSTNGGTVVLECSETGARLELEDTEESIDVSLSLEDEDRED